MPRPPIEAQTDKALKCYHQKLSWKMKKVDWSSEDDLYLKLQTKIPGSLSIVDLDNVLGFTNPHLGGCAYINKDRNQVAFSTQWPKKEEVDKISLKAVFTIKLEDGSSVSINCGRTNSKKHTGFNQVFVSKRVKLEADLLYDEEGCFTIEAELKVVRDEPDIEENSRKSEFAKDMGGIFSDKKTSDVLLVVGEEKFYCHKNILSARCEVFKNMLAPNTIESESNTIEVKEVPAEAVEIMLKYIYTGEVPDDPEKLTLELLNLAEMYLLDHLKETCLKSLMERLDVVSCISTFIMADRYMQSGGYMKEMVVKFMTCKAEEVVELEDWDKLLNNHPVLAKEVMRSIVKGVKEKHKCQFCVISYGE